MCRLVLLVPIVCASLPPLPARHCRPGTHADERGPLPQIAASARSIDFRGRMMMDDREIRDGPNEL